MKLPEIMEEIVNCIKIQCDNELEVYPIYNMFLARFSSAIASKNVVVIIPVATPPESNAIEANFSVEKNESIIASA